MIFSYNIPFDIFIRYFIRYIRYFIKYIRYFLRYVRYFVRYTRYDVFKYMRVSKINTFSK